jgi:hypothetical protein
MPRTVKLAAAAIAIALTAAIVGSIAYGSSRAAAPSPAVSYGSPASPGTTKLVIRHVRRGCHVWSRGAVQTASLRLGLTRRPRLQVHPQPGSLHVSLTRDARLQILNRDHVAHQLVQLAGPPLVLRGHMMNGKAQLITFSQPGLYRFANRVVKMGPEREAKTIGRDNTLRLTVSVR